MGRFDALTQIDEKPKENIKTQEVILPSATKKTDLQVHINKTDKQENPKAITQEKTKKSQPNQSPTDKPAKYSTLIKTELLKKIKLLAAEKDIKDYEVIDLALTEYFDKNL